MQATRQRFGFRRRAPSNASHSPTLGDARDLLEGLSAVGGRRRVRRDGADRVSLVRCGRSGASVECLQERRNSTGEMAGAARNGWAAGVDSGKCDRSYGGIRGTVMVPACTELSGKTVRRPRQLRLLEAALPAGACTVRRTVHGVRRSAPTRWRRATPRHGECFLTSRCSGRTSRSGRRQRRPRETETAGEHAELPIQPANGGCPARQSPTGPYTSGDSVGRSI